MFTSLVGKMSSYISTTSSRLFDQSSSSLTQAGVHVGEAIVSETLAVGNVVSSAAKVAVLGTLTGASVLAVGSFVGSGWAIGSLCSAANTILHSSILTTIDKGIVSLQVAAIQNRAAVPYLSAAYNSIVNFDTLKGAVSDLGSAVSHQIDAVKHLGLAISTGAQGIGQGIAGVGVKTVEIAEKLTNPNLESWKNLNENADDLVSEKQDIVDPELINKALKNFEDQQATEQAIIELKKAAEALQGDNEILAAARANQAVVVDQLKVQQQQLIQQEQDIAEVESGLKSWNFVESYPAEALEASEVSLSGSAIEALDVAFTAAAA